MLGSDLIVRDAELPTLTAALSTDNLRPSLACAVGLTGRSAESSSWSVEVLKHWPGKRCTIRYRLVGRTESTPGATSVIGKVYRRAEHSAHVHEMTRSLRGELGPDAAVAVPVPLAVLPELGLALQQDAPGSLLSDSISSNCSVQPFADLGRWLASLHDSRPFEGLRVRPLERELDRIASWSAALGAQLSLPDERQVRRAVDILSRLGDRLCQSDPTPTHRDFYPGNVLWDGEQVRVIDFDWLALGEPSLDVGNFLAQIEKLSHLATGRWDSYAKQAAAFRHAYVEARSLDLDAALPFALGATLLKLGSDEVQRQRSSQWGERARALAMRACHIAEAADRP